MLPLSKAAARRRAPKRRVGEGGNAHLLPRERRLGGWEGGACAPTFQPAEGRRMEKGERRKEEGRKEEGGVKPAARPCRE